MSTSGSPRRRVTAWRALLHAVGIVLGWALFVWFWVLVASRPWASRDLWLLITGSLILLPLLTGVWVAHNVALFRRLGPRRSVPLVQASFERDALGRPLVADWPALRDAPEVVVEVVGSRKHYVATGAPPRSAAGAGARGAGR